MSAQPATKDAADSSARAPARAGADLRDKLDDVAAAADQSYAISVELAQLAVEVAQIMVGRSQEAPPRNDRRFTDPAWTSNPVFNRIAQTHLASVAALQRIVEDLGDGARAERVRFAVDVLTSAWAPTNFLVTNPAAIKRAFDTGGMSLVRGVRNYMSDLRRNGGMPSMVERHAFEVGRDLAVMPGAVVARDAVAELLQYSPTTETVYERPVLVVPPPIGRFYFLDLAPGRSFVEYAVSRGLQTFMMSWRNPAAEQGDWDLGTYAAGVLAAIDSVREISGSDDVNVIGFCAGGIITTTLLNHLTAIDDDRVHSMSYAVTLLDFGERAPISAFSGRRLLGLARHRSRSIITSRQMGAVFSWMRPNDLIFNYWVNNYLMGEQPPAFDILAWNADGTNLPGALHCQFLDIFQDNLLAVPGAMTVLGTPLQLANITVPTFVAGAVADHLTPWKGCYRTTQLLGGDRTFVLSSSGHIASLVNPPGNPKARYWTGDPPGPDPDAWLAGAQKHQGSWWQPWADWTTQRAGDQCPAAQHLGSEGHSILDPAPGRYVRD
jgi:polyhydroxyalkanoate synthase